MFHLPLGRNIGEEASELLHLTSDRGKVKFCREEVCHLQEEEAGECRSDQAVVDSVPQSSPVKATSERQNELGLRVILPILLRAQEDV